MRILHVLGGLNVGGIEKYLLDFIEETNKRGHESAVFSIYETKPGILHNEFYKLTGRVYTNHVLKQRKTFQKTCKKIINEFKPDIVHSHVGEMSGEVLEVFYTHGKTKNIVQVHNLGAHVPWFLLPYKIHSRYKTLNYAHRIIAVSALAYQKFVGQSGRGGLVIPVGLSTNKWRRNNEVRKRMRDELGLNENEMMLLHVGRFHAVKNHGFMIVLAKLLKGNDIPFKMFFVGFGKLFPTIENLVQENKVSDNVMLLGERDDVSNLMMASDVLLLPSFSEGTPRVLLEASALGLPFICTKNADISDLFEPGCQLNVDNPFEWVDAIIKIKQGERTPPKPIFDFSIQNVVTKTVSIYDELMR
jgi:glycosyltransferase EpsF